MECGRLLIGGASNDQDTISKYKAVQRGMIDDRRGFLISRPFRC